MLAILDLGPNVLAYRAEGKLEREDVDRVFAEMDRRMEEPGNFNVYAEVHSLSGISLEALWQDVKKSVARWNAVKRIDRAAVVTDLEWIRRAAVWEDRILSGIEIRTFSLAERSEAEAWVRS